MERSEEQPRTWIRRRAWVRRRASARFSRPLRFIGSRFRVLGSCTRIDGKRGEARADATSAQFAPSPRATGDAARHDLEPARRSALARNRQAQAALTSVFGSPSDLRDRLSGYSVRDADGRFDAATFAEKSQLPSVKAISIKLSQGAKPGLGGVLPGAKVSAEIAATRGVPIGKTVVSPPAHSAFTTPGEFVGPAGASSAASVAIRSSRSLRALSFSA